MLSHPVFFGLVRVRVTLNGQTNFWERKEAATTTTTRKNTKKNNFRKQQNDCSYGNYYFTLLLDPVSLEH